MTIKILIETDGIKLLDEFKVKDANLQEVAVVLLRIKQIELELIAKKFQSDLEYESKGDDEDDSANTNI